jgi:hypothetical protein
MLPLALTLSLALAADPPEFTGSFGTRGSLTMPNADSTLSTADLPIAQLLLDANLQGRGRLLDDTLTLSLDASAFVPLQRGFADANADGELDSVDEHETLGSRPFVVFSEAYASWEPMEHLVLTVGKKRVVWGPGMVFNPTDVLNPPRDPTDAALQRAGVLMAKVDAPFEFFTVSALVSPAILEETAGIPSVAGAWPETRIGEDDDLHWTAVLRGYALVWDTDVNAWVTFSHLYGAPTGGGDEGNDFEYHPRFMLTLSKTLFEIHEVHAEVLVEQGSTRRYADADCADSHRDFLRCMMTRTDPITQSRIDDDEVYPRILVGWRPMLEDGTMFSVEYYYQADGMMPDEWDDYQDTLTRVGWLQRNDLAPTTIASPSTNSGLPNRASFNPSRRHYLIATAQKPQLFDDFTVMATVIASAEDLSGLASGSVLWSAAEWLNLSLIAMAPFGSVVDPGQGEFDGAPFSGRVLFEARAFF